MSPTLKGLILFFKILLSEGSYRTPSITFMSRVATFRFIMGIHVKISAIFASYLEVSSCKCVKRLSKMGRFLALSKSLKNRYVTS